MMSDAMGEYLVMKMQLLRDPSTHNHMKDMVMLLDSLEVVDALAILEQMTALFNKKWKHFKQLRNTFCS
jgi:hypothetical protein